MRKVEVSTRAARLCSYYAEQGGLMVGYEDSETHRLNVKDDTVILRFKPGHLRTLRLSFFSDTDAQKLAKGEKPRYTYTVIIEMRKHGKGQAHAFPVRRSCAFFNRILNRVTVTVVLVALQLAWLCVGVFCPHHRYGAGVGHRGAQWAEPAHRFVSGAQGRKQRL